MRWSFWRILNRSKWLDFATYYGALKTVWYAKYNSCLTRTSSGIVDVSPLDARLEDSKSIRVLEQKTYGRSCLASSGIVDMSPPVERLEDSKSFCVLGLMAGLQYIQMLKAMCQNTW